MHHSCVCTILCYIFSQLCFISCIFLFVLYFLFSIFKYKKEKILNKYFLRWAYEIHLLHLLIGDYYRLNELEDMPDCSAWMFVSPDRKEALVSLVLIHLRANAPFPWFRLQGLQPDGIYSLEVTDPRGTALQPAGRATGAALMHGGHTFPFPWGDYRAMQLHLTLAD